MFKSRPKTRQIFGALAAAAMIGSVSLIGSSAANADVEDVFEIKATNTAHPEFFATAGGVFTGKSSTDPGTPVDPGTPGPSFDPDAEMKFTIKPSCGTGSLSFGNVVDGSKLIKPDGTELPLRNGRNATAEAGQWTAKGEFGSFGDVTNTRANMSCLESIDSWGKTKTTDLTHAFSSTTSLVKVAEIPAGVTNLSSVFQGSSFDGYVNGWDTSKVTQMSDAFGSTTAFNQQIDWDTSSVTDMSNMFEAAKAFNSSFGPKFDTSNVRNMSGMFLLASAYNQPLGAGFDTSNVTDMSRMFESAKSFNSSLGSNFSTANVTDMSTMFMATDVFNQPLGSKFDTSKVKNMDYMFFKAGVFNQDLGAKFNTGDVTTMDHMFEGASRFNQPVPFDTSKVTNMNSMFGTASDFNRPISFNMANVKDMRSMFSGARKFDQDLSKLNVRNDVLYTDYIKGSFALDKDTAKAKWIVVNGVPVK